jgi:hypothetical protein
MNIAVSGRSSTYGETGAEPNAAVTTTMERDGPTSEPPLKSLADKCADAQHKTTIELQSRLLLALLDHLPTAAQTAVVSRRRQDYGWTRHAHG